MKDVLKENADKIEACQQLLGEVVLDLIKYDTTMKIARDLTILNNGELDRIRKELL